MSKPRLSIYPGDWVMLRDREFPMRVQYTRRCGRGYRVFGNMPAVEIEYGGGVHVVSRYMGFNAKDVIEVRSEATK